MRIAVAAFLVLTLAASVAEAQGRVPAESLVYSARSSRFGGIGRATMWTEDGELRGVSVAIARFEFRTRVALMTVEDRSASWIAGSSADMLHTLRYTKYERNPLGGSSEDVEIMPDTRMWSARDGRSGALITDHPLDELSFIYLVRVLPLEIPGTVEVRRHYDSARNPVRITYVGRDTLETASGRFRVVSVEMRVNDPRRYKGDGVIRFDLSDDACRLPVRIRSAVPLAGTSTLTLEFYRRDGAPCTAQLDGSTSALPLASRP